MNKIRYISILVFCFLAIVQKVNPQNIQVELQSVKKTNDEVIVSLEIDVEKWDSKAGLTITPIIYNELNELALEPFRIVGKTKHIAEIRKGINDPKDHIFKTKRPQKFSYKTKIPYEEWMNEVSIGIDQSKEGCCLIQEEERRTISENKILSYKIIPEFRKEIHEYEFTELEKFTLENPFLHPSENYENRYELFASDKEKKSVQVYFNQGISKIDIDFGNNREVLINIEKAFKLIDSTPEAELSKVMIAGFASPEGSETINNRLADQRAKSVKEFIKTVMTQRYDENIFEFFNGGKDWDGLLNLLNLHPELSGCEEAIDIIKNYRHQPDCNDRLKKINNGSTYAYLLKEFYPQLRNAGFVQVYYDIVRTAEIATLVADDQGRTIWIDTESPINLAITRLNDAIALMSEAKFDEALNILAEIKEDKRAFNSIGVCYMMQHDYDKAEEWFKKAINTNDLYAEKNLKQVKIAQKVEK